MLTQMIGLVIQNEILQWAHFFALNYAKNDREFRELQTILSQLPELEKDGFSSAFEGEYIFSQVSDRLVFDQPLAVRWKNYREVSGHWLFDLDDDADEDRTITLAYKTYAFLATLFPRFYYHKNDISRDNAEFYFGLAGYAKLDCASVPKVGSELETGQSSLVSSGITWKDVLTPNSYNRFARVNESDYLPYIHRRCRLHAKIEATKAAVSLLRYHKRTGAMPDTLQALVPRYVGVLPLDPYGKKTLKYSVENNWVYSMGINHRDDGGNASSCFSQQCEDYSSCDTNLTLDVFEPFCQLH